MTHFAVLAFTDTGSEDELTKLLAPYDENDEWGRPGSRWDWWMIGGRFSGLLDASYDPETDPTHIETCRLCGGTGDRAGWRGGPRENQHPSGCNGCSGTGKSVKWPTQWSAHPTDVMPASRIDMDRLRFVPSSVLTPDGTWHERVDGGFGMFGVERGDSKAEDAWAREFSSLLEAHRDRIAVVVDCHV